MIEVGGEEEGERERGREEGGVSRPRPGTSRGPCGRLQTGVVLKTGKDKTFERDLGMGAEETEKAAEGGVKEILDHPSSISPTSSSPDFIPSCRICQTKRSNETLISPCNCKGTLGNVHLTCLERWLNMCGKEHCEICRFQFQAERRRRYGFWESIRVWLTHPRHRLLVRSDLLVGGILTLVTLGLCIVCAVGMKYFVVEGLKLGISPAWTEGAVSVFLIIILLGYITTIYLMGKDHFLPWWRWWRRSMVIKIIFIPDDDEEEDHNESLNDLTTEPQLI